MVEFILTRALASRLRFHSEAQFEELFYNPTAPLSSLSAKIKLGRSLAIYDEQLNTMLDRVRRVRNVFAHSIRPLDFTHELIENELNQLPPAVLSKSKLKNLDLSKETLSAHRARYLAVCFGIVIVLEDYANRHEGSKAVIDIPDGPKQTPSPLPRKSTEPRPPDDRE